MPGGYVVRDANGQALVYVYSRASEAEALQANDGGRGATYRHQRRQVAWAVEARGWIVKKIQTLG
jgi:hypothetical protein